MVQTQLKVTAHQVPQFLEQFVQKELNGWSCFDSPHILLVFAPVIHLPAQEEL